MSIGIVVLLLMWLMWHEWKRGVALGEDKFFFLVMSLTINLRCCLINAAFTRFLGLCLDTDSYPDSVFARCFAFLIFSFSLANSFSPRLFSTLLFANCFSLSFCFISSSLVTFDLILLRYLLIFFCCGKWWLAVSCESIILPLLSHADCSAAGIG